MEVSRFQVVVVGTGPTGGTAARILARAGLRVAIVDSREYGGTCPNRGCDPKKVLRVGAELAHRSRSLARTGIAEPARIDWPALMRFKRSFTEPVAESTEAGFASLGIATYHGTATFVDEGTLRVGDRGLAADRFVIATGAKPRTLGFPGAELLATSEDVLDFDDLPENATFIGGGYVSFELAHILNACGVACTIIHHDDRPLRAFDPVLVRALVEASREAGIEVVLGADVIGVEAVGEGYHVHAQTEREHHAFETDVAIHGAGREPNIEDLDLAAAGVSATRRGIEVDAYLRATERVYAAGDCSARGPNLTPVGELQGRIVAHNILGRTETYQEEIIPSVLFTLPELAGVGLTEEAARAEGVETETTTRETSGWFSSRRIGQERSGSRIVIDTSSGLIVGAHLLGEGSAETIHLFALAMREGIRASSLKDLTYAFPTHASDVPSLL